MSGERFAGISMRIWNGISGAAALIGLVALLGGGAFAVLEYFERQESARAAETLRMIEIWETRGAEAAYLMIAKALEDELSKAREIEKPADDRLEVFRENIARRALKQVGGEKYLALSQFFTRLSLCVQANLCSDQVARTFFNQTLRDFRYWFRGEIDRRRKTTLAHAREVDWLLCKFAEEDSKIIDPTAGLICPKNEK